MTNRPSSVSVVIPFYKRQNIFQESLESIISQSVKPLEIIVVDDASGGDATEYLSQFSEHIRIITLTKNVGVSQARNIGVESAEGEYIAFLDSDDLWTPLKLEKQLAYFETHSDCDVLHTGTVSFYPDETEVQYIGKPARLTESDLVKSSHVMFQSVMMRRDDFISLGGFDSTFKQTEDYEFSMRLISNGYNIDFIKEPLVRIRHGSDDKLSLNPTGFLKGHLRVVWRYANIYQKVDGRLGPIKHSAKYLIKGGYKKGGIVGVLLRIIGRCLYPTIKLDS